MGWGLASRPIGRFSIKWACTGWTGHLFCRWCGLPDAINVSAPTPMSLPGLSKVAAAAPGGRFGCVLVRWCVWCVCCGVCVCFRDLQFQPLFDLFLNFGSHPATTPDIHASKASATTKFCAKSSGRSAEDAAYFIAHSRPPPPDFVRHKGQYTLPARRVARLGPRRSPRTGQRRSQTASLTTAQRPASFPSIANRSIYHMRAL